MFRIDVSSRSPIYEQLCQSAEQLILAGILKPGDSLPSVRKLAIELSVNPNTIQRAYSDMVANGYVYSVAGKGCFVSENAVEILNHNAHYFQAFKDATISLKKSGVSKESVIEIVNEIFERKD